MKRIKCLTIIAKEWFDRVNGNSYFSARAFIDNDTENPVILRFQYGYGDQYLYEMKNELVKRGILPDNEDTKHCCLTRYLREEMNINVINTKHENCLKRDVKRYGEEI